MYSHPKKNSNTHAIYRKKKKKIDITCLKCREALRCSMTETGYIIHRNNTNCKTDFSISSVTQIFKAVWRPVFTTVNHSSVSYLRRVGRLYLDGVPVLPSVLQPPQPSPPARCAQTLAL